MKDLIHQRESKNEWLLLSATFMVKFGLVFVLTLENALRLRDEPVTISGNSERFEYLNFVTYFLKKKKLFQKTGVVFLS